VVLKTFTVIPIYKYFSFSIHNPLTRTLSVSKGTGVKYKHEHLRPEAEDYCRSRRFTGVFTTENPAFQSSGDFPNLRIPHPSFGNEGVGTIHIGNSSIFGLTSVFSYIEQSGRAGKP